MSEPKLKGFPLSWWEARYSYNPDTGIIIGKKGHPVGRLNNMGYSLICVHNPETRSYFAVTAHRLAWILAYRQEPPKEIDHIDINRANNKLSNLREATRSQQLANSGKSSRNTSGFKGVSKTPGSKKFRARIEIGGKYIHLGYFDCPKEAHEAYMKAANEHFGEFSRSA